MKYLGLILVVALVAGQVLARRINENDDSPLGHYRAKRGYSDKLRDFLEIRLKNLLREGNETMGVPPLDPFESELFEIELNEKLIKGPVKLSEFEVLGLADYNVDKAVVSTIPPRITVGLTWPHLFSRGSYKLNVVALNKIDVYGEGEYEVTATDLSFETVISLKIIGGVAIKKMTTKVSLGNLALSMTGLYDDEDASVILSEVVSDVAPQLLEDYQEEITAIINEKVMTFVNKKLEGKSLNEIMGLLG